MPPFPVKIWNEDEVRVILEAHIAKHFAGNMTDAAWYFGVSCQFLSHVLDIENPTEINNDMLQAIGFQRPQNIFIEVS